MPDSRLSFAVEAVRAAAKRIRKFDLHRGDLRVSYKGPGDPVTNADFAAEAAVLEMLAEWYPHDGVMSEEREAFGDQDSCWVLDPIDGTTNYLHGVPCYAVSLAWCKDGRPELGVIYDICRDEMYTAARGRGAHCDQRRIHVSDRRSMREALLGSTAAAGAGTWRWDFLADAAKRAAGFRRTGSGTLDLAFTARGALDASFGAGLHYWDYAAGGLILSEAGGVFCDLDGELKVPFGARIGLCIYGSPRIVGDLRRSAIKHNAASDMG